MSDETELEEAANPGTDLMKKTKAPGWLEALDAFLDRAYLQADRETGC